MKLFDNNPNDSPFFNKSGPINPEDFNEFLPPQDRPPDRYDPQVVVKFRDDVQLPYKDNIEEDLDRIGLWSNLKEQFPNIQISRLFKSVPPAQIQDLMKKASARNPDYIPPNFLTYFIIDYPDGRNPVALAHEISTWENVEQAYVVPKPAPPPNANPILDFQNFLNPAKEGINARYAWSIPGGNGENIRLIDMEKGWYLGHPGLPAGINPIVVPNSPGAEGHNRQDHGHGTAVLGIVLGQDPGANCLCAGDTPCKCTGIAKKAITYWVSEFRNNTDKNPNKANAILAALAFLNSLPDSEAEGSVLLLESQSNLDNGDPSSPPDFRSAGHPSRGYAPIEVYKAEFDAIQMAINVGVVVIEAAGNAPERIADAGSYDDAVDLDALEKRTVDPNTHQEIWRRILRRPVPASPSNPAGSPNPDFQDSGAIMVGASTWALEHQRKPNPPLAISMTQGFLGPISATAGPPTNYGSRIDCYAWGEYVKTTGSGTTNINDTYTSIFSGTSSAAAIIAGVALVVQGIAKAKKLGSQANKTYSPSELRSILSDQAYGTASNNPANDRIGVMPDLKKILDNRMGLPPH